MEATTKNGYTIQIDEEDAYLLDAHNWRAYKNRNTIVVTARRTVDGKDERLSLSRIIVGAERGQWVWHLNDNPLDVRKENLKVMHRPTGRKSVSEFKLC